MKSQFLSVFNKVLYLSTILLASTVCHMTLEFLKVPRIFLQPSVWIQLRDLLWQKYKVEVMMWPFKLQPERPMFPFALLCFYQCYEEHVLGLAHQAGEGNKKFVEKIPLYWAHGTHRSMSLLCGKVWLLAF